MEVGISATSRSRGGEDSIPALLGRTLDTGVSIAAERLIGHERRGTVWHGSGAEPTPVGS